MNDPKRGSAKRRGFRNQAQSEYRARKGCVNVVKSGRVALRLFVLLFIMGVTLLIRPAWAGSDGTAVPGLGKVIYHEGNVEVFGNGPDVLNLSIGAFDAFKTDPASAELRGEYRWGEKLLFVGPMVGILANTDGGVFGYGGVYFDIRVKHLVVTPSAGLGGYRKGDGKALGGTFQFHMGADLTYRFDDGSRLGVKVTHVSNAFIHDKNPGEESVLLTYTLPVSNLF